MAHNVSEGVKRREERPLISPSPTKISLISFYRSAPHSHYIGTFDFTYIVVCTFDQIHSSSGLHNTRVRTLPKPELSFRRAQAPPAMEILFLSNFSLQIHSETRVFSPIHNLSRTLCGIMDIVL
jgi:hypothetical protein